MKLVVFMHTGLFVWCRWIDRYPEMCCFIDISASLHLSGAGGGVRSGAIG